MPHSSKRSRRVATVLLSTCLAVLLPSCVGSGTRRPDTFRRDPPRGPGSFCALNPEGCPPPAPRQTERSDATATNLTSRLKACEAGGETLRSYCRSLEDSRHRALCWSVVLRPKQECLNMCHRIHACDDSGDCARATE